MSNLNTNHVKHVNEKKLSEKDEEITIILYIERLLYKRVHPVCVHCTLHCFNDTVNRQIACLNI